LLQLYSIVKVYEDLQEEGYLYDYERVPVTDEKSPEEQDFDTLVSFTPFFLVINQLNK